MKRKNPMSQPVIGKRVWHDGKWSIYQREDNGIHELFKDGESVYDGTFDEVYSMKQRLARLK